MEYGVPMLYWKFVLAELMNACIYQELCILIFI